MKQYSVGKRQKQKEKEKKSILGANNVVKHKVIGFHILHKSILK